ncbi:hypothetical protein I5M27_03345 [Adhaeribacter sp. BT258]|uniref:Lipocalin-like domain-containing protein n=1 Tax=Adhaeribacter terrigena TaxID=2793070 RepID=A0ABS1BXY9_9BACT|nr:hypothetical protein [Adhaeribacter terrigena]MBK0402004.1 hypothetical protein [Adhaeribacter terrigena]
MKQLSLFILFLLPLLSACNSKTQQENLRQKEASLLQKEQELLVKEKTLELKEAALAEREEALKQPVVTDTLAAVNEALLGKWAVKMTCSETTCPGSAVGDTKTEQWEITYQDNKFIAKAIANNNQVRMYSGIYTGNTLELIADEAATPNQPAVKIIARLRKASENTLEGQREITRATGCKIIYELQMSRE